MSDGPTSPAGRDPSAAIALSMRFPADDRFLPMLEMAVRVVVRSLCGSAEGALEIARILAEMVPGVTGTEPIEVVLAYRPPELQMSVASGTRQSSRAFTVSGGD